MRHLKISSAWLMRPMEGFNALGQIEKTYVVGMALCLVGILGSMVGAKDPFVPSIFLLAGLLLCGALACEAYAFVVRQLASTLFKWLMVPAAVMVSAYSLGSAANILNSATGQDPGLFPRATAFMAPIAAIPALALLLSLLVGIALLGMILAWGTLLSWNNNNRPSKELILLGRIGGAFATLCLISHLTVEESRFERFVEEAAGWIAQGMDMHVDRTCASGDWDRVLRINEDLVLVASRIDDGLVFRRATCALSAD